MLAFHLRGTLTYNGALMQMNYMHVNTTLMQNKAYFLKPWCFNHMETKH